MVKIPRGISMFHIPVRTTVFTFLLSVTFSQNGNIKGSVSDRLPLPGANIQLKETNFGTTSNVDGYFEFLTCHLAITLST